MNRRHSSRYLGYFDGRPLFYKGNKPVIIIGAIGLGKSTHYFTPNILIDDNSVICASDVAAEQAMLCGAQRLSVGKVWADNPYRILPNALRNIPYGGCNQMASIDPDSPKFPILSAKLAAGLSVKDEGARDKFWQNTSRTCLKAVIMAEVRRGECPNLARVAELVHGDMAKYAEYICKTIKDPAITHVLRRFITGKENEVRSLQEVSEQMRSDSEFVLDPAIGMSVSRGDYQPSDCRKEITTIFNIMPIDAVDVAEKYLRLQLTHTISSLVNPDVEGSIPVTVYVEEYGLVGKNGMDALTTAIATSRKFQVTFVLSVTCLQELQSIHKDWESLIANAGATIWMTPIFDRSTAEYLSKLCGEKDVYTESISGDEKKGAKGQFGTAGRRVLTPAELAGMDEDQAIVFTDFSKGRPIVVKHRSYMEMGDVLRGKVVGRNIYYERV
jgi:type IV secretion system protein VirD4